MGSLDFCIRKVENQQDLMKFIRFPWRVYRDDPYWVPPLISERKAFLNPHQNPFFEHAEVELFLAQRACPEPSRRDGETVGTIAAMINDNHNDFHEEKAGFFGLFEVIEDYAVAEGLLVTARSWVKAKGMDVIRGPMNLSINDECGLLVDGFDSSPVVMMTYNPRYYVDFFERFGLGKAKDLYAYLLSTDIFNREVSNLPPKFLRVAEAARKRAGVRVRRVNMRDFDAEVEKAKAIYNSAWEKNWGAVPMTDAEFNHLAQGLRKFLDPDLLLVAETSEVSQTSEVYRPVGVFVGLPDVNQPLLHVNGRLFPFGWIKYLWYRRKIDTFRAVIMGVIEEYREKGIDALMYVEAAKAAFRKGYRWCEMSWILEDNVMMNRILQRLGGEVYKTYRIYELRI
jgi:GNAT superfamily N-acetyltransferase